MADVDLSQFDDISDRVARARAKSEAVREARAGTGAEDADARGDAAAPSGEATAGDVKAAKDGGKSARPGLNILEFAAGMHFKLNDRAGRVTGIRYELVSLVYDDDPEQLVTADRYRLSQAHADGKLVFAPKSNDYRPERVAEFGRIGFHDYVWLDTRKGMTAKKKRPRHIAIINPDYCTGCNACIEVCPTDCIEEVDVSEAGLDGIGTFCEVRLDDCIGCIQCVNMCPWEAIAMVNTDKVEEAYQIPAGTL